MSYRKGSILAPMNDPQPIVIPTPFPVGPVNVYLLDGPEPALVDAGPDTDEAMEALREGLSAHGRKLTDIQHLVITHAHPDHYGLAARVVAESDARLYSHRFNMAALDNDHAEEWKRTAYYAQIFLEAGVSPTVFEGIHRDFNGAASYSRPVEVDFPLDDNDRLMLGDASWEVIHTPGHARGHICLYHRPSSQLLSGDHLLAGISSNPILEPPLPGEHKRPHSLRLYLQSLERVASLELSVAWPGHGEQIRSPRELIGRRIDLHRQRLEEIASLLRSGPQSAYEIANALFPGLAGINVFLGVSEVIGHLDILEATGRIAGRPDGGVTYYSLINDPILHPGV